MAVGCDMIIACSCLLFRSANKDSDTSSTPDVDYCNNNPKVPIFPDLDDSESSGSQ